MRRAGIILGTLLLAGCGTAQSQSEAAPEDAALARGQAWYVTCQGCHGNSGEGYEGMHAPRLAGLSAAYIEHQLDLYRKGLRGGPEDFLGVQMNGRARALPDGQAVSDVSAYIASLPAPAPIAAAGNSAAGRALYASCAACHGEKGEGNSDLGAPTLAGTDPAYLARQLRNFRDGVRGREGDEMGQQMKAAVEVLPDDAAIDAVAAYAASAR